MKPREEYDKEALLVFADLEQKIGRRNLLFARRNIFLILLYILCCVEFTLKRFRGEKKKKKKRFKKVRHSKQREETTTTATTTTTTIKENER